MSDSVEVDYDFSEIETPRSAFVRYRRVPGRSVDMVEVRLRPGHLFTSEEWEFVRQAIWHSAPPRIEDADGVWLHGPGEPG